MEIIDEDAEDITSILNKIGSFSIYHRNRKNRKPQTTFCACSKNKASLLEKLGKYPHSSENHKQILEYIPKEYHLYFLRGLIDGDGCISLGEHSA